MVAYDFKPRFVTPILSNRKKQTVRGARDRHANDGETIQLYTGLRTKGARLLGLAVCVSVMPITIDRIELRLTIAGRVIDDRGSLDDFAQADGFDDADDMFSFFQEIGRPEVMVGFLITWRDFIAADNSSNGVAHVDG